MAAGEHGKVRHFTAGASILTVGGLYGPAVSLDIAGMFGVCPRKAMVALVVTDEVEVISLCGVQSCLQ
jgi:hypothetical protein